MSDGDQATIKLTIEGVDYPLLILDDAGHFNFTPREWGIIKRIGGVLPAEMPRAVFGGDQEFYVALAVVAMRRSGRQVATADEDRLLDGVGLIEVVLPDKPADGVPPTEAPAGAEVSEEPAANGHTTMTPEAFGVPS